MGIPWLEAAERGDTQATLTLSVVGRDVTTPLVITAYEPRDDGTVSATAAYWWRGTDARDLEGVMLRQLRESGEVVAAAHMEVDIQGIFVVSYHAESRRPITCRHGWTTTHHDPTSGTELTSTSTHLWTFRWDD